MKYRPDKYTYKSAIYDITEQVSLLSYEPILLEQMLIKIQSELNKKDLKSSGFDMEILIHMGLPKTSSSTLQFAVWKSLESQEYYI